MLDYPLENLGPERFQRVCQALLVKEFPSARLLPVGQPDGGRDAFALVPSSLGSGRKSDLVVFQVKFARDPTALADPRKWVLDAVEGERAKIETLAKRGATRYRLITNVRGSAHLDTGSVDKLDAGLAHLPIPADGWWRDDLLGRLDDAWDLKWSFPELLTGPDMLRAVIQYGLAEDKERRGGAISAFLADQYEEDARVKFKQVELENRLLDLFVDVPLRARYHGARKRRTAGLVDMMARQSAGAGRAPREADPAYWDDDTPWPNRDVSVGAALFFLHDDTCDVAPWVVLEGAPGQGKSTVSQYICQVHRMRLLGLEADIRCVPEAMIAGPLRLPFRIDLRDLASWLHSRNPFGDDAPNGASRRSLETFMAAQIEFASGGVSFSVSDLHAIGRVSSFLIVLDGLDEVADIGERRKVVAEVTSGVRRLRQAAASMQVLVTSRPAAFENSPGFAEEQFFFCELTSLPPEAIADYAECWIRARGLRPREATDVRRVLKEKLSQPHMRELARNPMQLAILLSLIHRRGPSLPDKRTALYDSYVHTFFDREAEKTEMVQRHRDLLVELHQYLAWVLQTEAELGNSQGSVDEERLRRVLREYLQSQDKDIGLVDVLFQSLVERVVAIVSRVQGTYEFEVQPLREYFAARYLYDTAPQSPPGAEAAGDKTDRFDALARNFYWLNVTRFFAGCCSKGELPSLVDRLQVLSAEAGFSATDQPRVLSTMLLSDWVFAQHPRSMKSVVDLLLDNLASRGTQERGMGALTLPEGSGRSELADRAWVLCGRPLKSDRLLAVAETLRANSETAEMTERWMSEALKAQGKSLHRWLRIGLWTGSLARISDAALLGLLDRHKTIDSLWLLGTSGRGGLLDRDPFLERSTIAVLNGDVRFGIVNRKPASAAEALSQGIELIPDYLDLRIGHLTWWRDEYEPPSTDVDALIANAWSIVDVIRERSLSDPGAWFVTLAPWNATVEAIREGWGDRWMAIELAVASAGIRSSDEQGSLGGGLFDDDHPLCQRARYARMRAGSADWWGAQLDGAEQRFERLLVMALFLAWASPKSLAAQMPRLEVLLARSSRGDVLKVRSAVGRAARMHRDYASRAARLDVASLPASLDPRLVEILSVRFASDQPALIQRCLSSYEGSDPVLLGWLARHLSEAALGDPALWPSAAAAARRAYTQGVAVPVSRFRWPNRPETRLPRDLAESIVDDASRYPLTLVSMAEASCRTHVGLEVLPLAEVAQQEHWHWI